MLFMTIASCHFSIPHPLLLLISFWLTLSLSLSLSCLRSSSKCLWFSIVRWSQLLFWYATSILMCTYDTIHFHTRKSVYIYWRLLLSLYLYIYIQSSYALVIFPQNTFILLVYCYYEYEFMVIAIINLIAKVNEHGD